MIVKRIISAVTAGALMASVAGVFSGCSMKEFFSNEQPTKDTPTSATDDGVITNGEWLAMVNDAFGMQVDESAEDGELDAAKAWGVIGEDETIDKNAPVNDKFIASTLTRAAGYATPASSDEEVIQAAIEHGIISNPNDSLSQPAQALQSLTKAQDSWSHKTFDDYYSIDLSENVTNLTETISTSDVEINGTDVKLPSQYAENLKKDDVVIVPKNEKGEGGGFKVISVAKNEDGTSTVKTSPASYDEIYEKIDVQGQFTPDYSTFTPLMDGVTVKGDGISGVSNTNNYEDGILPLSYTAPSIEQLASKNVSSELNLSVKVDDYELGITVKDIVLNAKVNWDFTFRHGLEVDYVYMGVDYKTEYSLEYGMAELPEEKTKEFFDLLMEKSHGSDPDLELGKVKVPLGWGLSVVLKVKGTIEASGKLSITVTTQNTKGFEFNGSEFRSINTCDFISNEVAITGEAGIYVIFSAALSLDYVFGECDLVTLELKVGPTIEASMTFHDESGIENDMLCIDVTQYTKVELKLYLMKTITDMFDLEASVTLIDIDKDSSPDRVKFHLENLKLVPACTAGEQEATEPATTEPPIAEGHYALDTSYISLDIGTSGTIRIKSLPTGYSASDVVWTSNDSSKVKVDASGNVTAVSAGSAIVTAQTKDGKYSASCAVNVKSAVAVSNGNSIPSFEAIAA